MVQKAKLDILENIPDVTTLDASAVEVQTTLEAPSISGEKWALNKLVIIGAPVLVVVLVIAGLVLFYSSGILTPIPKTQVAEAPLDVMENKENTVLPSNRVIAEPEKANMVYCKDFIIDLKDKNGRSKVLLFDLAFDLNEEKIFSGLENRKDVRSIIYLAAKGRSAVALRSVEERKKLKTELSQELNKILGEGSVKNVYFTNYVIM
jgi:flagellar basal body-associated protein FliL